jgi:hypothetical protein
MKLLLTWEKELVRENKRDTLQNLYPFNFFQFHKIVLPKKQSFLE